MLFKPNETKIHLLQTWYILDKMLPKKEMETKKDIAIMKIQYSISCVCIVL